MPDTLGANTADNARVAMSARINEARRRAAIEIT